MENIKKCLESIEATLESAGIDLSTKEGRKLRRELERHWNHNAQIREAVELDLFSWDAKANERRLEEIDAIIEPLLEKEKENWIAIEILQLERLALWSFPKHSCPFVERLLEFDFDAPLQEVQKEFKDSELSPENTEAIASAFKDKLPPWVVSWFGLENRSNEVTAKLFHACVRVFDTSPMAKKIRLGSEIYREIHSQLSGPIKKLQDEPRRFHW